MRSANRVKPWKSANRIVAERVIFRLHLAVPLEFVGDRCGRDVVEQLFGARLLDGGFAPRLLQLLDGLVIFDQPSALLQLVST